MACRPADGGTGPVRSSADLPALLARYLTIVILPRFYAPVTSGTTTASTINGKRAKINSRSDAQPRQPV
jgi:hypothetical protein